MRLKTQDARRWLMAAAVVLSMAFAPGGSHAAGLAADFCGSGEVPGFHFGFMDLASILGDTMGTPIECEHPDNASGDTLQGTTTGLVFYRASTNTPTFTDGFTHWALTDAGMITWTGGGVDPPGVSPPASAPPSIVIVPATPDVTPLPPPQPPAGVWVSVSEQAGQNNSQSFSTTFVPAPQYPYDNRLFRLVGNGIQMSTTQGRTWGQLSSQDFSPCAPSYPDSIVLSPTFEQDATIVLAGQKPCAISRDGGRNWNRLPTRISSSYTSAKIAFSPTFAQDQRLWLTGIIDGHASMESSSDGGRTWTSITLPLLTAKVLNSTATGSGGSHSVLLLAMDDGTRNPAARYFRSTDLGVRWQEITEAFRDPLTLDIPSFSFRAGTDPDRVYAATTQPVLATWYSSDGGGSWRKVSNGVVRAVTTAGCGVISGIATLELSCDGGPVVVAPLPPDTSPSVLSVASFADQGTVLVGAAHGLWVYPLRP